MGGVWQWYVRRRPLSKIGIGCGTLFLLLVLCTCSFAAIGGSQASKVANQPTATAAPTQIVKIATSRPTSTPRLTPTATARPTPTPTATPAPTPTPTPVPTQAPAPTQAPVPTQAPAPTQAPPPSTGVNGNPWGYDFTPGNLIYNPPADFCGAYFSCVSTFWSRTNGYVVECVNGLYSHSGGVSGACSRDGGIANILYQH